jgi:hypothetical protein
VTVTVIGRLLLGGSGRRESLVVGLLGPVAGELEEHVVERRAPHDHVEHVDALRRRALAPPGHDAVGS